jgi:hypothetical protein
MTQHGTVRTDHERQIFRLRAELFDQAERVVVAFVDHRMRVTVARQKALQRDEPCVVALAYQDRAARALFDQRDAPQDQRTHDALAQFRFRHDQRA